MQPLSARLSAGSLVVSQPRGGSVGRGIGTPWSAMHVATEPPALLPPEPPAPLPPLPPAGSPPSGGLAPPPQAGNESTPTRVKTRPTARVAVRAHGIPRIS